MGEESQRMGKRGLDHETNSGQNDPSRIIPAMQPNQGPLGYRTGRQAITLQRRSFRCPRVESF